MTVNRKAWRTFVCGVILVVSSASGVPAQQPIRPVPLTPFGDGQDSVLMEDLSYRVGTTSYVIVAPAGFVTDFASTRRAIWSVLPPTGLHSRTGRRIVACCDGGEPGRPATEGHHLEPSGLPIPALVTRPEYQRKLSASDVRAEATPTSPPAYCAAAGLVNLDTPW